MRPYLALLSLTVSALLAGAPAALAQAVADTVRAAGDRSSAPVRTLAATRLVGDLRIDGWLDDPAWAAAEPATEFTQSWPHPGAPPSQRTEVRVLYDERALYVAARMYDTAPDSIAAQLARRDAVGIYSDWVHVMVDSYFDRRTAFRFTVNPRGVMKDVFTFDDGNEDLSWDAVWEVATQVDSLGWTAEYRIPFSQLRFGAEPAGAERIWGIQFQRDIARHDERVTWSPWTRQDPGFVSRFGQLTGLAGVRQPQRLELQPYARTSLTRAPGAAGNPFYRANDASVAAGADLKYGLPLGLTLTATVNPDFGQVEVDPAVVNLTAFETFFPEQRPFFVEGADIFQFGRTRSYNNFNFYQYFYSRRVGRQPQRGLFGPEFVHVDMPVQTAIAAAAKVSGKTPGGWTVGLLDAVTTPERARYVDPAGEQQTVAVEPLSNYFVGRLRRDLRGGRSVVGGMLTATHRDLADPALAALLRSEAYFGGLDFEHTWANRNWSLSGFLAGSNVHGEPGVITATQASSARYFQRPDAAHLSLDPARTRLAGHMGELALARTGGGRWIGSLSYRETGPGFELNDLGFLSRADARAISTFLRYGEDQARGWYRWYGLYGFSNHAWNFGGDQLFDGYAVGGNAQLRNFWNLGGSLRYNRQVISDRLTRGGPLAAVPAGWTAALDGRSDARRRFSAGGQILYSGNELGGWNLSTGLSFELRPSTSVRLSVGPTVERLRSVQQYVRTVEDPLATATFGRRYLFADLRQTTFAMNTRLDWTFTPNLSLQLFAQPFVSAGDYSSFKELLAPRSLEYGIYGQDQGTLRREEQAGVGTYEIDPDGLGPAPAFRFRDPDFNFRSLRGNAVLRWEYRPGSALFLVWQQQRSGSEPFGDFDFGRDTGAIFREPATNVFLLKATYWIGR